MRRQALPVIDTTKVAGKRLVIALSGGADSVALLNLLVDRREASGLTLFAAHLDHGIRPESAEDAEFCRALCKRLDVPFYTVRMDIPAEASRLGTGTETLARDLRYKWLRRIKAETGSDYIALAHHLNDQAETVLMHLSRGTGPEGIAGMREFRGDLYRPLLRIEKRALTNYLESIGCSWREDATNAVADTPRNILRLNAIPALETAYPGFARAVSRYAEAAQAETDYVSEQTSVYLDHSLFEFPHGRGLELDDTPHPAILRRALRTLCGSDLPHERLNEAEALCHMPRGRIDLPSGGYIERTGSRVYFVRRDTPVHDPVPLSLNGKTVFPGIAEIEAAASSAKVDKGDPFVQVLRRDALQGCVVRTRRNGDRIRPLGCGDKLLSDYLTDRKIDRPLRDCIPLIASGNRVHWVCGLGISAEAAIRNDDDDAVRLHCTLRFDIASQH